jgi:hypothetical protein
MSHAEDQRRYRQTSKGRATQARSDQRYYARYPERRKANNVVNHAVRDGRLVKPDACEHCGADVPLEGSHTDYSRPLDVEWLCVSCHRTKDKPSWWR